jgi:hypothetical protein
VRGKKKEPEKKLVPFVFRQWELSSKREMNELNEFLTTHVSRESTVPSLQNAIRQSAPISHN